MPSGGFRAGSGRPKGARDLKPRKKPTSSVLDASNTATPGTETGVEYLARIMNDPTADTVRRDRCAAILATIESKWTRPAGKRENEQAAAEAAILDGRFRPGLPPGAPKPAPRETVVDVPRHLQPRDPPGTWSVFLGIGDGEGEC